ncbi:hypothetical protein LOK74_02090 [Brevibacillus humidisoli]|uniref:hypothetical protein n=1 Tax=Brevibacillus humidisoli TaxID=2895522 RepID=UPI001E31CB68|nr:hypothetical protein [Brevibacillus humidisoli]UFJ41351.1 hypothetical protein LOK74_02090 [Brevibacillus humidisoli]
MNKLKEFLPRKITQHHQKGSVQSWIPVQDVAEHHMTRQDRWHVAGIRVSPKNIDLLSQRERKRLIHHLKEVQNGLRGHYQIYCVGRSVDLDGYMSHLEEIKAKTEDPIRKKILQSQIKQAAQTAISGESLETLFFILFAAEHKAELIELVKHLVTELRNKGIGCYVCDHKELMDMQFVFTHPVQAAYERIPEDTKDYLPPQFLNPERMKALG